MHLIIERAALEFVLERAVSASYLLGHIEETAADRIIEKVADNVDEVVHRLTELLGHPCIVASAVEAAGQADDKLATQLASRQGA